MNKIKVLVVDDSALMRKIISDMINSQHNMDVVGTARNGKDLLEKLNKFNPDVITLDVEMPIMDGIAALRELKKKNNNVPVIVLSGVSRKSTELTMDCLQMGAFDLLPKPSGEISLDINKVKDELILKINAAYERKSREIVKDNLPEKLPDVNREKIYTKRKRSKSKIQAVVIGASTGGPKALYSVITKLPENLGVPVFVVQHMPAAFTKAFADRLNSNSKIKVVEARQGEQIDKNVVYIAPGGFHMGIDKGKTIELNTEPAIWGVRPAVDKLFISASKVYGANIVSAVLTGMGKDGADGTVQIKKNGGITISEDKSTCTIYGMPKAAFETGMVDIVLPIDKVAYEIEKIVKDSWR